MPIYTMQCNECEDVFEIIIPFDEISQIVCEKCESTDTSRHWDGDSFKITGLSTPGRKD